MLARRRAPAQPPAAAAGTALQAALAALPTAAGSAVAALPYVRFSNWPAPRAFPFCPAHAFSSRGCAAAPGCCPLPHVTRREALDAFAADAQGRQQRDLRHVEDAVFQAAGAEHAALLFPPATSEPAGPPLGR
jgi:hypothetical protein